MAITTTGFQAPATKREGLKPSVYENIILIGADETPILKLIGTSSVKGIEHSWLTDSLAAPKKNAQLEISDFDDQIKSSVQKTSNAVQIFTSNVSVSRSMQAVATYGGKELERETAKRAKEHKLDMEYAIFGLGRDADVKTSLINLQANSWSDLKTAKASQPKKFTTSPTLKTTSNLKNYLAKIGFIKRQIREFRSKFMQTKKPLQNKSFCKKDDIFSMKLKGY